MIYDCFLFCHELRTLKLRLEELYDWVDAFVLVESDTTFMGDPKPLFYAEHKDEFEKWNAKIRHIIVKDNPITSDPKDRETWQRDAIIRGLFDLSDDDTVFINDADEIPDVKSVGSIPHNWPGDVLGLNPYWAALYLNCKLHPQFWPWMRAAKGMALRWMTPSQVRWTSPEQKINNGWHLQMMEGAQSIVFKCRAFSHCLELDPEWFDAKEVTKLLASPFGKNMFSNQTLALVEGEMRELPKTVQDHPEAWRDWFFKKV